MVVDDAVNWHQVDDQLHTQGYSILDLKLMTPIERLMTYHLVTNRLKEQAEANKG
jgi:hypothetical protein